MYDPFSSLLMLKVIKWYVLCCLLLVFVILQYQLNSFEEIWSSKEPTGSFSRSTFLTVNWELFMEDEILKFLKWLFRQFMFVYNKQMHTFSLQHISQPLRWECLHAASLFPHILYNWRTFFRRELRFNSQEYDSCRKNLEKTETYFVGFIPIK